MVDLPDADSPVSQIVRPCWLSSFARSLRVSALVWKVIFLRSLVLCKGREFDGG